MNTQTERPKGHVTLEEDPNHNVVLQACEGHDEHGEKKSVLKKVKAKAKKIKDTIKGHVGHGNELDHDHDHDHDEDEDGREEMETDPEVHGAHIYQSSITGQQGVGMHHDSKLGERSSTEGVIHPPMSTAGDYQPSDATTTKYIPGTLLPVSAPGDYQTFDTTTTRYVPGQEESLGHSRTDTRRMMGFEEQPFAPKNTPVAADQSVETHGARVLGTGREGISEIGGREKFPHALKHEGEAHVLQPFAPKNTSVAAHSVETHGARVLGTGGEGIPESWGREKFPYALEDEGEARVPETYQTRVTGLTGTGGVGSHGGEVTGKGKQGIWGEIGSTLERGEALERDPHAPKDEWEARDHGNYQAKVTDPTGMGSKEIGVTPIMHQLDKMKIFNESDQKTKTGQEETLFKPGLGHDMAPSSGTLDEKSSVGSHDQFSPEPMTPETSTFLQDPETQVLDATTQTSDQLSRDKEEEQKPGSYTDKISSVASIVADKAKQATTAVTSKLGYGASTEEHDTQQSEKGSYGEKADKASQVKDVMVKNLDYGGTHEEQPVSEPSKAGSIGEYGKKVATTVQDKLAPVYEKVAEVGSTVASKVQGSGTDREAGTTTKVVPDKGVSVKEYLVEKLKPGEEDKALSEVITEALPLHKKKEESSNAGEERKKVVIKERVTESDEVKQRLGEFDERSVEDVGSGSTSPGRAMLDRIKDAATSWFGKGGETQPLSRGFYDTPEGDRERNGGEN